MQKKVLVVDDENIITEKMRQIIAREGYNPITASDGIEALNILKKETVDLLLTDAQMPRLGGFDLIRIITGWPDFRKDEYAKEYFNRDCGAYNAFVEMHKSTKRLMMSKDLGVEELVGKIGAHGFFPKSYDSNNPFNEAKLTEILHKYLSD